MSLPEFKDQLNSWGRTRTPFFFCIDFELEKPLALTLDKVSPNEILFDINGFSNTTPPPLHIERAGVRDLKKFPISFSAYEEKFNKVLQHLEYGDSFLTNLTIKTKIETEQSLRELFQTSAAKYKLLFDNRFLVFSPETFIRIDNNKIFSYPMKGTIDADIPSADEVILADEKEKAEHITIVDLIRNDLSLVAEHVHVSKFRYIDKIKTSNKDLLQVSSEITGTLPDDWSSRLGDVLVSLLPAGSISGAPKKKTVEIIAAAEQEKRGYYTGVFGYFDGQSLDSGVMIRFIERDNNQLYYRSGGGITTQSDAKTEYQEAIDKVYVPVT
jgi:para-aminobenzoate synthetase component 1